MNEPRVLIIGAGLAGLAAGIYARLNGWRAHIVEHAARPGGVAATWQRKGYAIDGGIHYHMDVAPGTPVHRLYRTLGVWNRDRYLPLETYTVFRDLETGRRLEVTRDLDRLADDLKSTPGGGTRDRTRFIDRLIGAARALSGTDMVAAMPRPPELGALGAGRAAEAWTGLKTLFRLGSRARFYTGPFARPVAGTVPGPAGDWFSDIACRLFLPQNPVWFTALVLGLFSRGGLYLRTDGSGGFTGEMESRFLDLGGEVTYRATVDRIETRDGRAVGVRLAGGERLTAGAVIAAGDGHSTIFNLLRDCDPGPRLRKIHSDLELFPPLTMFNFGVGREMADRNWFHQLRLEIPLARGCHRDSWLGVRVFNYGPGFAPPGRCLVQVITESDWRHWAGLRRDRAAYREEKRNLAAGVLNALDRAWPGLAAGVDMTDVATPHTWWRYTLNRRGSWEGFLPTPRALMTIVPRTLPGLAGLAMAGQWVMPGGGVIPSMVSGAQAVEIICRRAGMPFRDPAR